MGERGSDTRSSIDEAFAAGRFVPRIATGIGSFETLRQAVRAGMGPACLSIHTIGLGLRAGVLAMLDIEGVPGVRRWHVVYGRGKGLPPVALEGARRMQQLLAGRPGGRAADGARAAPRLRAA